jgi:hypothetical protein
LVYKAIQQRLCCAFNEKGEIIPVDSYTDEHYDVSLSIDKDGKPKIERTGNQTDFPYAKILTSSLLYSTDIFGNFLNTSVCNAA